MKKIALFITLLAIAILTSGQILAQSKKQSKSKKQKEKTEKVFVTKANASRITLFVHSKKYNDESFLIEFRTDRTKVTVGYPNDKSRCTTYSYSEKFLKACEIINNASFTLKSKAKGNIYKSGELVQISCYHGKNAIYTVENCNNVKNCNGNLDLVVGKLIELAYGKSTQSNNGSQNYQKKGKNNGNSNVREYNKKKD